MSGFINHLKNFISYNKKDIVTLLILFFIFIITAVLIGPVYGDLWVDCGREAYIPELMAEGKILYKDIFALFSPLSYQFNTLLYIIFGPAFKVLYIASYVNAMLMLCGLYLICRCFMNQFRSAVFVFFIMYSYVFALFFTVISHICPYSLAFVYAVTLYTFSVFFFLRYMKNGNIKLAYLSIFLAGMAYANKPEFLLCQIPYAAYFIYKKVPLRTYIISLILLVLPNVVSWGILFLQGLTPGDFKNYISFCVDYFKSPEQIHYNKTVLMPPLNIENIRYMLVCFLTFAMIMIPNTLYFLLFYKSRKFKFVAICLFPLLIYINYLFANAIWTKYADIYLFSWQVILLAAILLFKLKKLNLPKEQMMLFVALVGILSMSRIGFMPINKWSLGNYFLLASAALWIYFNNSENKFPASEKIKNAFALSLVILSVFNVSIHFWGGDSFATKNAYLLVTAKGNAYNHERVYKPLERVAEYIDENLSPDDVVWCIPEGAIVNHLTGHPSVAKYHQITPNHISAIGEENIINYVSENKPDYIITHSLIYTSYGATEIGKDYGFKLFDFILNNYSKIKSFSEDDNFVINVYKKKTERL